MAVDRTDDHSKGAAGSCKGQDMSKRSEFEKEKKRQLSPAEKKRLERFESVSAEMAKKGYKKTELTIGIVWANVVTLTAAIPFFAVMVLLFRYFYSDGPFALSGVEYIIFIVAMILLVVAHELVHGIVWKLLRHHSGAGEQLIYDHPTQVGCVAFEK